MNIQLYKGYSHTDNAVTFGIVANDTDGHQTYINWVWYHLGRLLSLTDINNRPYSSFLYPFKVERLVYTYKNANDAEKQAKMIAKRIINILNETK